MNYFQGALHEIRNVAWPTEKETFRLTKITVVFVILFTLMFFLTDWVFSGMFTALYSAI